MASQGPGTYPTTTTTTIVPMDVDPPPYSTSVVQSPGRRMLDTDAILTRILEEVDIELEWPREAYGRLAQTCRSLFIPAIRFLWSLSGDIRNLAMTLPSDAWEEIPCPIGDYYGTIKLTRKLNREDLQRMRIYAPYITKLYFHDSMPTPVEVDAIAEMTTVSARAFGHPNFLPNLSSVNWGVESDADYPIVTVLMGPSLRNLTMTISGLSSTRLAFLTHIPLLCPHLTRLSLIGGEDSDVIATGSSLIIGWELLRSLSIKCVSTEVMMYAAKLQNLTELYLEHVDNIDWGRVKKYFSTLDQPSFLVLNSLYLSRAKPNACIEMVLQVDFTMLRVMSFTFSEPLDTETWTRLFDSLVTRCGRNLQTISMRNTAHGMAEGETQAPANCKLTIQEIRSLFPIKDLRSLSLCPCQLEMDDSGILEIAKAFPRLTSFSLETPTRNPPFIITPQVTIASLYYIAQNCPQIHSLTLAFDARTVPPFPGGDVPQVPGLQHIFVEGSPVEDTEAVAQYLKRLFPKINGAYTGNRELKDKWREVTTRLTGTNQGNVSGAGVQHAEGGSEAMVVDTDDSN